MSNTRSLIWTVSRSLALSTAAIALLSYSGHNFDRHSARGVALAETPASEPASRLDVFTGADGESYFALSLRPTIAAPPSTPHDICLLIDTSASQTGRFRDRAVESLQAVLASLSAEDRVQLSAVDLDIAPLTADFVAPNSDAMAEGIKQLSRRPSLGTTDLGLVLSKACELLEKSSGSRAIVYIGDGMSTANLLPTDKLDALMNKCVANRVAVTSLGLGPNIDTVLLAVLANHTGGNLALDNGQMSPQSLGQYLAQSAIGPVLWPTQITLPAGVREAYPRRAPPLRFDRDSVLIGAGEITTPQSAKIVVNTASATETLSWEISPSESLEDNAYLRELVVNARKTDGKTLATVGTAGLREARWTTNAAARDLVKLARQAIATGATDNAKRLVGEALRRDPANAEAQAIQGGLEKQAEEKAAPSDDLKLIHKRASSPFRLAAYQPPLAEDVAPPAFAPIRQNGLDRPGSLLAEEERRQRSFTEYMQAEVRNTLNAARSQMRVDPAGASEQLKTMLEMVRQAADLPANVRSDLRGQLERALQEAARQLVIKTDRDLSAQAIAAQQREQAQLTRELLAEEEKVDQLIARFNSLLDEGRFRDAEAVADVALALKPATPALEAAVLDARTVGYTVANFALREARQKGVIDTLQSVEASHIPTSDEPPIIYPDPEVWQLLTERRKKKYESVDLASSNKAEAKILAALDGETSIAFVETALGDAILELETQHDIQIELDTTELENLGITSDGTTLTRDLKGITLRSALKILLRDLDLTYIIENEVLLITSIEVAETKLTTKVYPVADLVVPPQTPQIGGGLGGGQGGQMGGGGGLGGGGGGGFGGGGGGGGFGGGGGQGGGGGGFFNVPPQFLPADVQNRLRQGFQAFAVEDDLKLSSDPVPATAKDAASSPNQGRTQTATIELPEGSDPKTAWDEYFASHDADPAALRETVRRSLKAKNYSQTVALIHAALLHGQGQPWMYEGLGIALQASGAPMVDVERAIMSALDFGATNNDLMYVAQYLSSLGAEKRAFELFRQVGDREPTRPEPFVHGLRLAKRLNDLDAIQWATIGVLSQAWTEKQRSVWDEAYHTALATLKRLQNERRTVEAQSYENALKEALIRDCVIIVSWTGDADIDLMVEEPGGSICSYRTPRTTAGGIMLGDTVSRPEKASSDGFQEVYVCPRGFSGDYRLLVRRVWGKVTADKVTVDIYKNYMTDKEELIHEQLPLGEKDALVTFAVNEGRRSESVAEHEIAQAVAEQVAIGNQVLAQQAAAANNGAAAAALANSLSDTPNPNPGNGNGFNSPFFLRGAVGYQPVIITLPEGAMLQAQAVISADRRYVRYSGLPFFSGVSEVNTFNYVSGASGTSQGGTGGIGGGGGSGGAGGIGGGGSGGF